MPTSDTSPQKNWCFSVLLGRDVTNQKITGSGEWQDTINLKVVNISEIFFMIVCDMILCSLFFFHLTGIVMFPPPLEHTSKTEKNITFTELKLLWNQEETDSEEHFDKYSNDVIEWNTQLLLWYYMVLWEDFTVHLVLHNMDKTLHNIWTILKNG